MLSPALFGASGYEITDIHKQTFTIFSSLSFAT